MSDEKMRGKKITGSFAFRFLKWFCPDHLYEEIEGDLIQKFEKDVKIFGEKRAKRRLWWSTLRFFRPGIILRNHFSSRLIDTLMIGNYFKVAMRNIAKRKLYSFINAVGLSIGIAFSVLIYLYIQDEKSFDRFHANKENIFRLNEARYSIQAAQKGENPIQRSIHIR